MKSIKRSSGGVALLVALSLLAFAATPALAAKTHLLQETFGSAAQPSFSAANALAVDQDTGDLLVIDSQAKKILRFHADGTPSDFIALGTNEIDGNGAGDGTPEGGFSFGFAAEQQVAVDNSGTATDGNIYVTQLFQSPLGSGGNLVDIFAADGEYLGQLTRAGEPGPRFGTFTPGFPFSPFGVTVDAAGNVYLGGGYDNRIYKFDPAANLPVNGDHVATFTPVDEPIGNVAAGMGPSAGTLFVNTFVTGKENSVLKLDSASGALEGIVDPGEDRLLTVDPGTGHLYAIGGTIGGSGSLADLRVKEFDASGSALISSFPVNTRTGIAVDGTSGRIYLSSGDEVLVYGPLVTVPDVTTGGFSILGTTSVRVKGNVNPDGTPLEECFFEYGLTTAYGQSAPCAQTVGEIGTTPKEVHADLAGLAPETEYHYRLVARNANATIEGKDKTVKTPSKPAVKAVWSEEVGFSEARLKAEVNPENAATTYRFEWGTTPAYGQSTDEIPVGSDQSDHTVVLSLEDLQPGLTYHYRLVATNGVGVSESPDHAFTTFPSPPAAKADRCPNAAFRTGASASLPDCRAFELVTPLEKANADIDAPVYDCCFISRLDQAADDGNSFSFSTERSFGDAVSSPYSSQYVATRVEGKEWSSHAISPPRIGESLSERINFKYDLEYKAFSPDLATSWLVHDSEPVLDECAVPGFANLYRRDNTTGSYEALTIAAPMNQVPKQYWPGLQGTSADGRVAVFVANAKLTEDASEQITPGGEVINQIYEHIADPSGEGCGELRLISVLPNGNASNGASSLGTPNEGFPSASRSATLQNGVSEDGTKIFWTSGGALYLHDDEQASTVLIASGSPRYWTAAADGSRAIYEQVVSTDERRLFEYDVASDTSTLIASKSEGVAGASEDADRLYFVSKEALGGEGKAGAPNLYLREGSGEAATTRLVATLAATDTKDFGSEPLLVVHPEPYKRGVRVTPDGQSIVFTSAASLTGYDNPSVEEGGLPSLELYRYEATSEELHCVSCNPSGQRPKTRKVKNQDEGLPRKAAQMPGWESQSFAPRVLSEDGKRLFFESFDTLLPRDTNGARDVYEWEAAGSQAQCEAMGAELHVPGAGGCLSLISTGQNPNDSELIDATPDGSDVFVKTASSLLPHDPGLLDVYDAREGGGMPPPPGPPAACEGEACQGPLSPPDDPTPASSAFNGPGNVVERKPPKPRCGKGKTRRKGRCVPSKPRQAKHTTKNRRQGR